MAKSVFLSLVLSALCAIGARAASPAEIPFHFTDGFICLEARVAQSPEPLSLLLDSGASESVLNLRTAQRLHLPLGNTQTVRGVGVEVAAYHLRGVHATANGVPLTSIPLALDLSAAEQLCSYPVDGLIGVGFFKDRVVQIDYTHHVLRIAPSTKATRVTKADRLPLKVINGVMCVPIGVNESAPRWARFDTGCNDSLHWVVPRPARHGDRNAISIGFITDTEDSSLTSVSFGQHVLNPVKTVLHGRPMFPAEGGLVGNGLLSQFTVTVDYRHGTVLLEDAPH
jgi:hypothetical protein